MYLNFDLIANVFKDPLEISGNARKLKPKFSAQPENSRRRYFYFIDKFKTCYMIYFAYLVFFSVVFIIQTLLVNSEFFVIYFCLKKTVSLFIEDENLSN